MRRVLLRKLRHPQLLQHPLCLPYLVRLNHLLRPHRLLLLRRPSPQFLSRYLWHKQNRLILMWLTRSNLLRMTRRLRRQSLPHRLRRQPHYFRRRRPLRLPMPRRLNLLLYQLHLSHALYR
jgi:hypothetical protein